MSEQLRFVAEVLDASLTGVVNGDDLLTALDIINGMIGEEDASEAQDSAGAASEDNVSDEQDVPADTDGDLGDAATAEV